MVSTQRRIPERALAKFGGKFGGQVRRLGVALSFLVIVASIGTPAAAQTPREASARSVTGAVINDQNGGSLGSVLITIRNAADSSVVATRLSDSGGRFIAPDLEAGRYILTFETLGYAPVTREVTVEATRTGAIDLGQIALTPAAIELEGVAVVTDRPEVTVTADRDIYSVDAMTTAAGGAASDVLENIPEIEMDLDGNVTVRGEQPTIYINGRPAPMRGEALAVFLQTFAAENIESIEMMANPSSRYEADGTGGIVNIVLRRGANIGVTGNVFANGESRGGLGFGGRATYMTGPLNLRGGTSLRLSSTDARSFEVRENYLSDPVTYLEQDRLTDRSRWSGNLDLTSDYRIRENTEITAEIRLSNNFADASRFTNYRRLDVEETLLEEYDRLIADDGFGLSGDVSLAIEHEFGDSGRELEFEIEYQRGLDTEESRIRRRELADIGIIDPVDEWETEFTWEEDRETESEFGISFDYSHPLGEFGQLEAGFDSEFGSTAERRYQARGSDDPDDRTVTLDRRFTHDLNVHAGYVTFRRRIGGLNAQVGLRGELAESRIILPSEDANFVNRNFNVFPNTSLVYRFDSGIRLRGSYSMRVRRPSSRVLNPTNTSSDPMTRRVGNPEIDPQQAHSVNFDASWSGRLGTLRVSPFVRKSVNEWERVTSVDVEGVTTSTYANIGTTTSYGTSFSASVRDFHGFGGSLNLNLQTRRSDWGDALERAPESMTWWSLRSNLNARVTDNLRLQTSVQYNPARDLPQGRSASTVMTRIGVRQQLMSRRASLNLNVSDPFDIYRPRVILNDANFSQTGRDRPSARRFNLSVSYNFGGSGGRGGPRGGGGPPRF